MRAALRPMPYRAVVLAIVRRLPLRLRAAAHAGGRNETDKRGTRPRPYGRGARVLGRGCARPDGHMPRFMRLRAACHEPQFIRSCAVVHAPARRLTCGRAAAPAIVRRLPLRLRAAAHAGGRNETDKQETRPRPYGRGARFGTGCIRSGVWPDFSRRRGRRGDGSRRGGQQEYFCGRGGARCGCHTARALAARGRPAAWRGVWLARLFRGGAAGGAPGMAAGPSVFCGAAGGAMGARRAVCD